MSQGAPSRPAPLRVPVTDVAVCQSLVGGQNRRREGLNPALIVVQRPVRYISDPVPPPEADRTSESLRAEGPETLPAGRDEGNGEARAEQPLELEGEELESEELEAAELGSEELESSGLAEAQREQEAKVAAPLADADDDDQVDEPEELIEVSVPPPAPPEALRRTPSPPASARAAGVPSTEAIDLLEIVETSPEPARVPSPPPPPPARAGLADAGDTAPGSKAARVQELRPSKSRTHAWWELFFDDDYLRTVRQPTRAQIARQCDFIIDRLGLKQGATVLDVGCGLGLHVAELASRGYGAVGLDLSLAMLSRASEDAQARGLRINFLHADMRDLSFEGSFDAVTCLGTSLGYFDDETNRKVIEKLLKALKPGGALLLDVVNRDHVIRSQPNLIWFEGEGCVCMEESEFNYFTSRLHVKRTVILDNGRQVESEYALRLYALHELGQLMNASGFRVTEVSGREALPGVFFGQESPNLMIVAVRRTANEAPAATTTQE